MRAPVSRSRGMSIVQVSSHWYPEGAGQSQSQHQQRLHRRTGSRSSTAVGSGVERYNSAAPPHLRILLGTPITRFQGPFLERDPVFKELKLCVNNLSQEEQCIAIAQGNLSGSRSSVTLNDHDVRMTKCTSTRCRQRDWR